MTHPNFVECVLGKNEKLRRCFYQSYDSDRDNSCFLIGEHPTKQENVGGLVGWSSDLFTYHYQNCCQRQARIQRQTWSNSIWWSSCLSSGACVCRKSSNLFRVMVICFLWIGSTFFCFVSTRRRARDGRLIHSFLHRSEAQSTKTQKWKTFHVPNPESTNSAT